MPKNKGDEEMNNIIFMAKETASSVQALKYLCIEKADDIKVLCAVVREVDVGLIEICKENNIQIYTEGQLLDGYHKGKLAVDYLFSFYWKKIGKEILGIAKKGAINFHPGPLPEARGSGYHIAILESWGYWGVTAHYMDEEFDTGEIIDCRHFQIDEKMVNVDLVKRTHKELYQLFEGIVDKIARGEPLYSKAQKAGRYFSISKLEKEKFILDSDTTEEVERKIRAFWNPPYTGAQICIKGKNYTVINEDVLLWIKKYIHD